MSRAAPHPRKFLQKTKAKATNSVAAAQPVSKPLPPSVVTPPVEVIKSEPVKDTPPVASTPPTPAVADAPSAPSVQTPALDPQAEALKPDKAELAAESSLDRINRRLYQTGIVLLLITVLSSVLAVILSGQSVVGMSSVQVTPIPEPTVAATPTPVFDRKTVLVEVQNGSGVKGAAGKAAQKLITTGYEKVITSNAEKNITGSRVYLAPDFAFTSQLLSDMNVLFAVSSSSGSLSGSTASARLIIGK